MLRVRKLLQGDKIFCSNASDGAINQFDLTNDNG